MPRILHHRTYDHFGTQSDTVVVLSAPIGRYAAGTTLAVVLADLDARLDGMASSQTVFGTFRMDAVIDDWTSSWDGSKWLKSRGSPASAVIQKTMSGSFSASAKFDFKGSFTTSSLIKGTRSGTFSVSANFLP